MVNVNVNVKDERLGKNVRKSFAKIREVRSAFEQSAKEAAEEDEGEGATEGPGLHLV